jgi:two-component system, NarL family, sensor histidine kinase LiaS
MSARGRHRIGRSLKASYALSIMLCLVVFETVAIAAIFASTNLSVGWLLASGVQAKAVQATPFFVHSSAPDRAALTTWLATPDPITPYPRTWSVVDPAGNAIVTIGPETRWLAAARDRVPAVLHGPVRGRTSSREVGDGAWVVMAPITGRGGSVQGVLIMASAPHLLTYENRYWAGLYLLWVVLPTFVVFLLIAAVGGGIFGSLTARGFTRRFDQLSTIVGAWHRGQLSARNADGSSDELGELSRQLDGMVEQFQQLLRARHRIAVLEERERLARELHDSVKQQTFSASLEVSTARALLRCDPDAAAEHLATTETLLGQAQQELAASILALRPAQLQAQGLVPALRDAVCRWTEQTEIGAQLEVEEDLDLPLGPAEAFYRVAMEALSNVARHSGATAVRVRLTTGAGVLTLTVEDDGRGFDPVGARGLGLLSMQERMQALGGAMRVETPRRGGTRILATATVRE